MYSENKQEKPTVLFYCTSSLDSYYSRLTGSVESVEGHSACPGFKGGV